MVVKFEEKTVLFSFLNRGECFLVDKTLCMKIPVVHKPSGEVYDAVCLENGVLLYCRDNDKIKPVEITSTVMAL